MQNLSRIPPVGPPAAYKTYQVLAPKATHFRPATCDEVECPNQSLGWRTVVDENTDLGQRQAFYIRSDSGRKCAEELMPDGLTVFTFEAGQQCFAEHQVSLERPELFLVRAGDHRGDPTGADPYRHSGPDQWLDDFASHQDGIADELAKG